MLEPLLEAMLAQAWVQAGLSHNTMLNPVSGMYRETSTEAERSLSHVPFVEVDGFPLALLPQLSGEKAGLIR